MITSHCDNKQQKQRSFRSHLALSQSVASTTRPINYTTPSTYYNSFYNIIKHAWSEEGTGRAAPCPVPSSLYQM